MDPFLDLGQEELQKLESALKSEKGRQILGENVAAMLGKRSEVLFDFYINIVPTMYIFM